MDDTIVTNLKNILLKYEAEHYLELHNNRKRTVNDSCVSISLLEWPTHIYYNEFPPIINNIAPYINGDICIYRVQSNGVGLSLNSPKYIVKSNVKNTFNDYELKTLKPDIAVIIKALLKL